MSACICDWPSTCGGHGYMHCLGCGGDLCVCRCGGESECFGCADCDDPDRDLWGDDEDDDPAGAGPSGTRGETP